MREVRIRDTLSGALQSIDPGHEVGIYACGPTVYSRIHIGNARPFVVFSLFARFLRSEGYKTRLVINVTDINDKIYAAATRAGEGSSKFAGEMTAAHVPGCRNGLVAEANGAVGNRRRRDTRDAWKRRHGHRRQCCPDGQREERARKSHGHRLSPLRPRHRAGEKQHGCDDG